MITGKTSTWSTSVDVNLLSVENITDNAN